jgi:hypothetical protein
VYYILDYATVSDNEAHELPTPSLPGPNMKFDKGILVPDPPDRITFTMTSEEKGDLGDYVVTGLRGLVISGRFKRALDAFGVDNVQYIPAQIDDEVDGRTYDDYFVANIIGLVDCIDMQRSKLTMRAAMPDKIRDINELHIDEGRARGHDLFRLDRQFTIILVSERLKKALERAKLIGVDFVEAEGYSI